MAQTDWKSLAREDRLVLGAGALVFVFSLLPYYGASARGVSSSVSAWHGWALVGILLLLASTIVVAIVAFGMGTLPTGPVSWNFAVAALSAVGSLCVIIRSFTLPSESVLGISVGLRWGAYLLMLACVGHTLASAMRLRSSGEAMPWAQPAGTEPPPAA